MNVPANNTPKIRARRCCSGVGVDISAPYGSAASARPAPGEAHRKRRRVLARGARPRYTERSGLARRACRARFCETPATDDLRLKGAALSLSPATDSLKREPRSVATRDKQCRYE